MAAMRGGALWIARDARGEPLDDAYAALIDGSAGCLLLGTVDELVVGFAAVVVEELRTGERLGVIDELCVTETARDGGVATRLAEEAVAFCETRGCVGVDAMALPGDRETKSSFEEWGFQARALVMHRRLGESA